MSKNINGGWVRGTMHYAIVRNQKPKKRSMNYSITQIALCKLRCKDTAYFSLVQIIVEKNST